MQELSILLKSDSLKIQLDLQRKEAMLIDQG